MLKNIKSITLVFLIICVIFTGNTFAQEGGAGQPGEFLRYGVGIKAMGLGKAYTGFAQGASSIYWNPAGLAVSVDNMQGFTVSTSLTNLYGFSNLNYFGVGIPLIEFTGLQPESSVQKELSKWSLGIGYLSFSMGEFEQRDKDNVLISSSFFEDKQSALFFSLARRFEIFQQTLDLGLSIKMISHDLFNQNSNATSYDLGLRFQPSYNIAAVGIKFQDINTPNLGFTDGQEDIIPKTSRLGLALFPEKLFPSLRSVIFLVDYDLYYLDQREKNWYFGTEISFFKINKLSNIPVKIRFGINSTEEKFSFGLSFDLPQNTFVPSASAYLPTLDWAYTSHNKNAFGDASGQYGFSFNYSRFRSENFYTRFSKNRCNKDITKVTKLVDSIEEPEIGYLSYKKNLKAAVGSPNPGNRSFPLSAQLGLGDLIVYESEESGEVKNGLIQAFDIYRAAEFLPGYTTEIDEDLNQISYMNYIQGAILLQDTLKADQLCSSETVWRIHPTSINGSDSIIYLCNIVSANFKISDVEQIQFDASSVYYDLLLYLLSNSEIENGDYEPAYEHLEELLNNQKQKMKLQNTFFILPSHIYIPYFRDCIMVDDILMKMAEIKIKESKQQAAMELYKEVAKYYLNTDNGLIALQKLKSGSSL